MKVDTRFWAFEFSLTPEIGLLGSAPTLTVTLSGVPLNQSWMNAGPIQMCIRSLMTSVRPELKWIHLLDLE